MRRLAQLFWLFAAVIFPVSALAQTTMIAGDVDAYVALLSADCPIGHGDAWALNAIEAEGDTICAVLQTPSSLAGFLSMLTGEGDNVKRMWLKQLKNFGHPWEDLIGRLTREKRYLLVTFHPENSTITDELLFAPEDLAAFDETDKPKPNLPKGNSPVEEDETPHDE